MLEFVQIFSLTKHVLSKDWLLWNQIEVMHIAYVGQVCTYIEILGALALLSNAKCCYVHKYTHNVPR